MKQFFQLLTICFGLLLILGVSGYQNEQKASTATESDNITLLDTPSGIIPEASTELPLPLFSRWTLLNNAPCSLIQEHEFITTAAVRTKYLFFRERFLEYSPGIAEKKGILLILPSPEGDHSRA